jgi:putative oxidoreductase
MENFLRPYTSQLLGVLRIMSGLLILHAGTAIIFGYPALEMFRKVSVGQWPFWYSGILELILGALLVAGLFTRPAAFILSGLSAFAFFLGHAIPRGTMIPLANGGTLAALFCFTFLYIAAAGGGTWSLDRMWRITKD